MYLFTHNSNNTLQQHLNSKTTLSLVINIWQLYEPIVLATHPETIKIVLKNQDMFVKDRNGMQGQHPHALTMHSRTRHNNTANKTNTLSNTGFPASFLREAVTHSLLLSSGVAGRCVFIQVLYSCWLLFALLYITFHWCTLCCVVVHYGIVIRYVVLLYAALHCCTLCCVALLYVVKKQCEFWHFILWHFVFACELWESSLIIFNVGNKGKPWILLSQQTT